MQESGGELFPKGGHVALYSQKDASPNHQYRPQSADYRQFLFSAGLYSCGKCETIRNSMTLSPKMQKPGRGIKHTFFCVSAMVLEGVGCLPALVPMSAVEFFHAVFGQQFRPMRSVQAEDLKLLARIFVISHEKAFDFLDHVLIAIFN